MARVIFHAGTHKTGTTTIQRVLASHRAALAERRVYYPADSAFFGTSPDLESANANFAVANAIARYSEEDRSRLARFIGHLDEACGSYDVILLSAESAYRHMALGAQGSKREDDFRRARETFVARMAEVFGALPVEIVIYFRRPDRFAESLYAESVTSGNAKSFEDYLNRRTFRFDYRFQIDLFARHFRTRVYCYETTARDGLVEGFFRDNELGPAPAGGVALRRSICNGAVLWIRRTMTEQPLLDRERRRRWLFALQNSSAALFQADRPSTFWRSVMRRDAFLQERLGQTPELAFPEPDPTLPPFCNWTDDMHRAAEAAFANWQVANRDWIAVREAARLPPFIP